MAYRPSRFRQWISFLCFRLSTTQQVGFSIGRQWTNNNKGDRRPSDVDVAVLFMRRHATFSLSQATNMAHVVPVNLGTCTCSRIQTIAYVAGPKYRSFNKRYQVPGTENMYQMPSTGVY